MNELKTLLDEAGTFLAIPRDNIKDPDWPDGKERREKEQAERREYIRKLNDRFGVLKLRDLQASAIEEYRAALRQYGKV